MKVNQYPTLLFYLSIFSLACSFSGYSQDNVCFQHLSLEEGLSQSTVECISKDHKGYMWFGTRDGLNKYDGYTITAYRHDPAKKESIENNIINDLVEDRQGNLWIATAIGLERFDRKKEAFQHYPLDVSRLPVNSLFLDSKGQLWIGTQVGLYLFNTLQGTIKQVFKHEPQKPGSLANNQINGLAEDSSGELWIATEGGLDRLNPQTQQFTHYHSQPNNPKSLQKEQVKAVFKDSKGNIWIGLRQGGMALYNRKDNDFTSFQHNPTNANSVAHNDISSFAESREGKLWIGTENGGISVFSPESKTFSTYKQDILDPASLSNNSIHALYGDEQGNIWVGTWAGGVSYFAHYKKIPGTNSKNSYTISGDIQSNPFVPPIVLTDFQIFNQSVKVGDENSPLTTPISETSAITLSYKQSVFSFEFAALDFSSPTKNQYTYQLEGFDEKWNPIGTQRKATYTHLDPGEYTFRIKACNNDGVWNEKGISVKLTITPPFWLTWWFKTIGCLVLLIAIQLTYRIKTYRITLKNKKLEVRVMERTQKIGMQKQELEANEDNLNRLNLEISQQNEVLEIKVLERTHDLQAMNEELASSEEELRQTLDNTLEINEKLAESKANLAEAQRIARFGSWELETDTQKVSWSEETLSIFGHERSDITPSYEEIKNRFIPQYREPLRLAIQAAIEHGQPYEMEIQIHNKTGQVRWTFIIGKPVFNSKGIVYKLIGTIVDITERKVAEQQLKQQNQELLKINAELDSFVYRASHDLRAPLSSLLGLINITKTEDNEELKAQYLQLMEKSVGKLDQFIQGIINYSRNARLEITRKPIDFQALAMETFEDLKYMDRSDIIQKQLSIEGDSAFFSDLFRLKIIFSNLISNAIRYSNPRVTSFLHIHIVIDAQKASIEFADNGYGIAQEYIGKIFDMFYRASQENVGSGLGLYIVKEVIMALDGSIQVQSEIGQGTSFKVILPNLASQVSGLNETVVINQNTENIS